MRQFPKPKLPKRQPLIGAGGEKYIILSRDSERLPYLIHEDAIRSIRHALETPIESDEDWMDLAREYNE